MGLGGGPISLMGVSGEEGISVEFPDVSGVVGVSGALWAVFTEGVDPLEELATVTTGDGTTGNKI